MVGKVAILPNVSVKHITSQGNELVGEEALMPRNSEMNQ